MGDSKTVKILDGIKDLEEDSAGSVLLESIFPEDQPE